MALIAVVAVLILIPGEDEPHSSPSPTVTIQVAPTNTSTPPTTPERPTLTPVPTFTPSPTYTSTPVAGPRVDDRSNSIDTAFLVFEGRNRGVINYPDDFDYFRLPTSAGELFTIEVELGTHPDTVILLFDRNGTFLANNDDFEGLRHGCRIDYPTLYDGDYFVKVHSLHQDSDIGSYGLFLTYLGTEPFDDHGGTIETTTNIDEGRIPSDIEVSADLDYFCILAATNTLYLAQMNTRSHPDAGPVLFDLNGELIK